MRHGLSDSQSWPSSPAGHVHAHQQLPLLAPRPSLHPPVTQTQFLVRHGCKLPSAEQGTQLL